MSIRNQIRQAQTILSRVYPRHASSSSLLCIWVAQQIVGNKLHEWADTTHLRSYANIVDVSIILISAHHW